MPDTSRLRDRRLYLCTPDRPDLERFIAACIDGGVDIVQLREKELVGDALAARAILARDVCRAKGVPFIVNDSPELARHVGADGVHVGQDDMSAKLARDIVGEECIVGLSTHATGEFSSALAEPIDYFSAGPIVETPTKPGRLGTGPRYIREVAETLRRRDGPVLPFFVTGGVTPEVIPALVELGASRFVVVRYLTSASDPFGAAQRLRSAIDAAVRAHDG